MNESVARMVYDAIEYVSSAENLELNKLFACGDFYTLFYPDFFREYVEKGLENNGITKHDAITRSDGIVDRLKEKLDERDIISLDHWVGRLESKSCRDCPAYQWVIHREGLHDCRLGFKIDESKNDEGWNAKPMYECIRPFNVGACYLIAKQLNRPEPLVGKLDAIQYEQYLKESEKECR